MFKKVILEELINIGYSQKTNEIDRNVTSYNYQGSFNTESVVVDGTYNFRFRLYSSKIGLIPMSSFIIYKNVIVKKGCFCIENLNFEDALHLGIKPWLEVDLMLPDSKTYMTLPRVKKINAIPYSLQADFISIKKINIDKISNESVFDGVIAC